jgi:hypothetical protein
VCSAHGADRRKRLATVLAEPLPVRGLAFTRWTAHRYLLCWPEGYDLGGTLSVSTQVRAVPTPRSAQPRG